MAHEATARALAAADAAVRSGHGMTGSQTTHRRALAAQRSSSGTREHEEPADWAR